VCVARVPCADVRTEISVRNRMSAVAFSGAPSQGEMALFRERRARKRGGVADWRLVLWYMGIVRKYNIRLAFAMVCSPA
jgi:hypothetical protein